MTTYSLTDKETFLKNVDLCYQSLNKDEPTQKIRAKAWDAFLTIGLPTKKDEHYHHVPLHKLFGQPLRMSSNAPTSANEIEAFVFPECAQSLIVFINGRFSEELSRLKHLPKQVIVSCLSQAMRTYSGYINHQWNKALDHFSDPFVTLNAALHLNGLFIYIPPKTLLESPIQILNIIDESVDETQLTLIAPRVQIFCGSQSQASFISKSINLKSANHLTTMFVDISLEEGSCVNYTQVENEIVNNSWHFEALHANLKRDAVLKTVAFNSGSATLRHDYHIVMAGENAEAKLSGLSVVSENCEAHTHIFIDHQAPNCRSMQLFKGILYDKAQSSFEGKIMVRQDAQKTEAFQLNQNLLLSDFAHADSRPNLEIFADDVKASHGSTIGPLDADHIFYMKARGFNEKTAMQLLVKGFCNEIIDMISVSSLGEQLKLMIR